MSEANRPKTSAIVGGSTKGLDGTSGKYYAFY